MQKNIEKGYEDYYKRKKKENFWKIVMWVILGVLVIAFGTYLILKN
jgi:succinate dehydrogenase hydrophobic anchor subunit